MNELKIWLVIALLTFAIMLIVGWLYSRRFNTAQATEKKNQGNGQPLIRIAFNGQEFVVRETHDMGDHWLFRGYITSNGDYSEVPDVSFRVTKGVSELRLGYYINYDYVLVDISDPTAKGAKGYLANQNRVWTDYFIFPESE